MAREPKPFNAQKIRDIGATARILGSQAEKFANDLDAAGFTEPLWVDAGDKLDEGIKFLRKWLAKLTEAYTDASLPYKAGNTRSVPASVENTASTAAKDRKSADLKPAKKQPKGKE